MSIDQEKTMLRAVEKATRNGWDKRGYDKCDVFLGSEDKVEGVQLVYENDDSLISYLSVSDLIYAHDFAKSLWGKNMICTNCRKLFSKDQLICDEEKCELKDKEMRGIPLWAHHLQYMVVDEEPLRYLGRHL